MRKTLTILVLGWLWPLISHGASVQTNLLDTTFNVGTGANGIIETVLEQPDGKILICGNFTVFNGVTNSYIARLNTDGSVDTNFNSQVSYWVRTMALQPDGKIVIGGFFTYVAGQSRNLIARLNSDGSLDTTFNPGTGAGGVLGVAVDGDADPFIFAAALQSDGNIVITGNFTNYNGVPINGIARVLTNGLLDTNFNVGAGLNYDSWGRSLTVLSNGQIMATGWFTSYNNQSYNRMVRLNTNGTPDTNFNPNFGNLTAVYGFVAASNGEYVVVGDCEATNVYFTRDMAEVTTNGSFDTNFLAVSTDKTESVRQQANGQIYIGGYFSVIDGQRETSVARLNADGSLDTNFYATLDNFVWDICLQTDGKVLISGGFFNVNGVSHNSLARLLPYPTVSQPALLNPQLTGQGFNVSVDTIANTNYTLQYICDSTQTNWTTVCTSNGNGGTMTLIDPAATNAARFYRVIAH